MAGIGHFFRRAFYFRNAPEDARVPEHGIAPRSDDTEVETSRRSDPELDADLHMEAAAPADTDTEAGAGGGGGIRPLKPRKPADS